MSHNPSLSPPSTSISQPTPSPDAPPAEGVRRCKLCRGATHFRFSLPLVAGLHGRYFECERCQMLQSYHLDELSPERLQQFYEESEQGLDSGAAWRQSCVAQRLELLARLRFFYGRYRALKVLDFGCGSGFVINYLAHRRGWHCFGYEPYATPAFSGDRVLRAWEEVVAHGPYDLVLASEVFEHFTAPDEQLDRLRAILNPTRAFLYLTTGLYLPGQRTADWSYLAPQSGQHVAFYSPGAIAQVGRHLGAQAVLTVGAEYEWLIVTGAAPLAPARQRALALTARLLQGAARLGILPIIE